MSGSINKILNDALDNTLLNENSEVELNESQQDEVRRSQSRVRVAEANAMKDAADAARAERTAKGEATFSDKALNATEGLRKKWTTHEKLQHPDTTSSDWSYGANKGKYHAAAAVAAGLGALALAKKLRNKKKKAAKK